MREDLLFNPDGPPLCVLVAAPFEVASRLMAWTPAHPEWDVDVSFPPPWLQP